MLFKKVHGEKGFTLVEVIVVAAIIAILAGILVPMIFSQIDEAKISRAKGDLRSLSTAIYAFRKDVGQWPACSGATTLIGDGTSNTDALTAAGYDVSVTQTFSEHLLNDANNCYGDTWKGPYFGSVSADPWGNPYFLDARAFPAQGRALLLSAGPNGVIDTRANSAFPSGDDIGIRVK